MRLFMHYQHLDPFLFFFLVSDTRKIRQILSFISSQTVIENYSNIACFEEKLSITAQYIRFDITNKS